MAPGPSPTSTSPPTLHNSFSLRPSLSSSSTSPPRARPAVNTMALTAEPFAPSLSASLSSASLSTSSLSFAKPPGTGDRRAVEPTSSAALLRTSEPDRNASPAIYLRRLPQSTTVDSLRNILLFVQDSLIDCEIVNTDDSGLKSAIARFKTIDGAQTAMNLLNGKDFSNGKQNGSDARLIVELVPEGIPTTAGTIGSRRNTFDSASARQGSISTASVITASTTNGRQSSRFNSAFQQSQDKITAPNATPSLGNGDFAPNNPFSPLSPLKAAFGAVPRNLGKTVINDESDDDDSRLLTESTNTNGYDPVGEPMHPVRRTNTLQWVDQDQFSQLGRQMQNMNVTDQPQVRSEFASPLSSTSIQPANPMSAVSPHEHPAALYPNGTANPPYHFHKMAPPPANPADQNPPCNTLYVGNLPVDTSEDELKQLFGRCRGYKRLCFRAKPNGPMCFVEFDDTTWATQTLNRLYGVCLSNSTKGGIRLSFSKNPLGVRPPQPNNMAPSSNHAPSVPMYGGGAAVPTFSAATGPPPGIPHPPGLPAPGYPNGSTYGPYPATNYASPTGNGSGHSRPLGHTTNDYQNGFSTHTSPTGQNGFYPSNGGSQNGYQGPNGNTNILGYPGLPNDVSHNGLGASNAWQPHSYTPGH
ncbi:hypothetical protein M011DRAFT_404326 [Sporormia fimetaria CBS 119925]|uniref:RRM domain-containing protein n=1 Tax=Sporormia fimetaria CBS 119925 TaxID=1340428 RepID=A0A6A6VBQ4_9PLEO|nr:hypothetical protein M011DRAFT_404326 [Sporormia fimetaria CBS 119925]